MSLQVWLPFTDGTLKQQGLSSETVTSGGTINLTDVGKLGKCATFGSAAGGITIPASTMTSFTNCSVAFWLKINDWGSSYDTYFQAGTGSTPWNNYIFGFLRNNTNSTICFTISNGSSASNANYLTSVLSINTWYHIALTYETGKCKIYLNGALDHEYSTTIVPAFDKITKITLGRSNNDSSYQTQCSINDFRIYDHTLSQMEVKELSKGLVLHYPLNRGGWGQENLAKNTQFIVDRLDSTAGSRNEYYAFNCGTPLDVSSGDSITISFDLYETVNTAGSGYLYVYNTNNKGPHQITGVNVLAGRTIKVGDIIDERISFTTTINARSDASQTNDFIEFYSTYDTSNWFKITNLKIEKGLIATPWCPNSSDALATTMGLNGTTEYDCSGYGNNGTYSALPTVSSNTPKYNVSTYFGAYNTPNMITNDATFLPALTNCTVAWWEYCTTTGNSLPFVGQSGSYYIGAGSSSTRLYDSNIGSSGITLYKDGVVQSTTQGTTVYHPNVFHTQNQWHHFVMTGVNLSAWTAFKINSYSSTWPVNAYLSDVRIYATALSADDVKSLYQNSAYIDSSGNVYGAVHEEG